MASSASHGDDHLERLARSVDRTLAPRDEMYDADEDHYFAVGRSALRAIRLALGAAKRGEPGRVLDMPCGHGRVLRVLRAAWPAAQITACDLDRDGVDFCARTFGARGVYSELDPARVALEPGSFDLIWVGSLLTHLSRERWPGFLSRFWEWLSPEGLLIFTTLGRYARYRMEQGVPYGIEAEQRARLLADLARDGIGYAPYSAAADYGITLAKPEYVLRELEKLPLARVVSLSEMLWDDHQDVVALQKLG